MNPIMSSFYMISYTNRRGTKYSIGYSRDGKICSFQRAAKSPTSPDQQGATLSNKRVKRKRDEVSDPTKGGFSKTFRRKPQEQIPQIQNERTEEEYCDPEMSEKVDEFFFLSSELENLYIKNRRGFVETVKKRLFDLIYEFQSANLDQVTLNDCLGKLKAITKRPLIEHPALSRVRRTPVAKPRTFTYLQRRDSTNSHKSACSSQRAANSRFEQSKSPTSPDQHGATLSKERVKRKRDEVGDPAKGSFPKTFRREPQEQNPQIQNERIEEAYCDPEMSKKVAEFYLLISWLEIWDLKDMRCLAEKIEKRLFDLIYEFQSANLELITLRDCLLRLEDAIKRPLIEHPALSRVRGTPVAKPHTLTYLQRRDSTDSQNGSDSAHNSRYTIEKPES